MNNFVCKKCRSTEYKIKDKTNGTGIAHGLYCARCGFWHKWLNKQELSEYENKDNKDKIIARLEFKTRLERAVELPVSVGDLVYDISNVEVQELKVKYINIEVFDVGESWMISCAQEAKEDFVKLLGDFYGIMWFTTKAEAESRLAELRGSDE